MSPPKAKARGDRRGSQPGRRRGRPPKQFTPRLLATVRKVLVVLRARGRLTKQEILARWPLDQGDYLDLKRLLQRENDVVSGPQRIGGVRIGARARGRRKPGAARVAR